jgi:hypothetical protein
MMGAVRGDLALSPKLKELAMCVVAVLNGAEYEWGHHAPLFVQAGGSEAQLAAMREPLAASRDATCGVSQSAPLSANRMSRSTAPSVTASALRAWVAGEPRAPVSGRQRGEPPLTAGLGETALPLDAVSSINKWRAAGSLGGGPKTARICARNLPAKNT